MHKMNLALIGFGSVGQEFARILFESSNEWEKQFGWRYNIVAIATRSRGTLQSETGINISRALTEIESSGRFSPENPDGKAVTPLEIAALDCVDTVIEISTLNIESGRPAADHIARALQAGKNVITANKGPIAFQYRNLKQLAQDNNCHFLFEGTVMDCAPVFNLARETLPGCKITGFSGILNSTTNYILCEMASGKSFETALATAQKMGWAEADPTMDLEGWDAAAKTAALLNVLMDADINPHRVVRKGITGIGLDKIKAASGEGRVFKLICEGSIKDGAAYGRVSPVAIAQSHPLARISGTSSALTLETDLAGRLTVEIEEPQIRQTAYALISDLLSMTKHGDQ